MNTRNAAIVLVAVGGLLTATWVLAGKPSLGEKLIDFELKTLDGRMVKTVEARAGKVLVLKFGATWCPWCTVQIQDLRQVRAAYPKDEVAVIDVTVSDDADGVREYVREHGVNYTALLDRDAAVAKSYGISSIPVVIVADREGSVVYRGHYTEFQQLKQIIDGQLKKKHS